MKNKEQPLTSNDNIRVALCQKAAEKKHFTFQKMAQFLKGGKSGHFAKAIAKQNGLKWPILGLSLKMRKMYRKYP